MVSTMLGEDNLDQHAIFIAALVSFFMVYPLLSHTFILTITYTHMSVHTNTHTWAMNEYTKAKSVMCAKVRVV